MQPTATPSECDAFVKNLEASPDFTIRVEEYEWLVHGRVLRESSAFFEKACNGRWKESSSKVIVLHDDSPWVIAELLLCLYHGPEQFAPEFAVAGVENDLDRMMKQGKDWPDHAEKHTKYTDLPAWEKICLLYQVANKYEVEIVLVKLREDLKSILTKDLSLTSGITEMLGSIIFKSDDELGEILVEAWFEEVGDAEIVYQKLETVFESDAGALPMVRKHLFKLLRQIQIKNDNSMNSIDTALNALNQVSNQVRHSRNNTLKRTLEEVKTTLTKAQKR